MAAQGLNCSTPQIRSGVGSEYLRNTVAQPSDAMSKLEEVATFEALSSRHALSETNRKLSNLALCNWRI